MAQDRTYEVLLYYVVLLPYRNGEDSAHRQPRIRQTRERE
jgi:hypothetical protein